MNLLAQLALAYGVSEFALSRLRRTKKGDANTTSHDAGTLSIVWLGVGAGIGGLVATSLLCPYGRFEPGPAVEAAALAIFALGIIVRISAIVVLGRHFTVDVAIHKDHQLITRGPYRWLRHPSYTGVLLVVASFGAIARSWPAAAIGILPVLLVLVVRIRVEERALAAAFGEAWCAHCERTWRLVPFVW